MSSCTPCRAPEPREDLEFAASDAVINRDIFDELFVLELANNHWGDVNRGLRIVKEFSTVVRYNDVRAAIKLQFRDVDNFIHPEFRDRSDIRYVKKTLDTQLTHDEMASLVESVRRNGCVRMATPFDEASVDLCEDLGIEIIKIASSDITDWPLLEKIAREKQLTDELKPDLKIAVDEFKEAWTLQQR